MPIASKTRSQIRQSIGHTLNAYYGKPTMIASTATSTVDATSLLDTYGLVSTGDDEYNGWQVRIVTPVGSIVAGETKWVSDYAGSTHDATTGTFSASITSGDAYEAWKPPFTVEQVNNWIAQAESEVYGRAMVDKSDTSLFTEQKKYLYSIPSGFLAIHTIEYNVHRDIYEDIHLCNHLWDELVDTDVTATLDHEVYSEGGTSLKLVVAAGASAGDILITDSIDSLDLSNCSEVEISIKSSVALAAGDIQLLLGTSANCAAVAETLSIPATSANTMTRHLITLANPASDTAIISVGIKFTVDKGACSLHFDDIQAVRANSRQWYPLMPEYWDIVHGSTDYLHINPGGLSCTGWNTQLRIGGYQAITAMSADTSSSEVDPDFIINRVVATLTKDNFYTQQAELARRRATTSLMQGTRFI